MLSNGVKLMASRAINKLGDVLYDYGNSSWIASMGILGQRMLGVYQIAELLVSICLNPFGGVLADRFKRRKILLWTDGLCALLCFSLSFITDKKLMLYGLILANMLLAISNAFSSPAYRAYTPEVLDKKELVSYNANLESIVQVIKVSSPILGLVIYQQLGIRPTLFIDGLTFLLSFFFLYQIKHEDYAGVDQEHKPLNTKSILKDIWEGLRYIMAEKEIFFLLLMAALVNIFLAMLTYLLPFAPRLFGQASAYATILSLSALGAILGASLAKKVPNTMIALLWMLGLSGLGIIVMALSPLLHLPVYASYSGALLYSLFETIFNIHFFSQVQQRVANEYMGRVFSTIYTIAILLMPLGTLSMTIIKESVSAYSFIFVGFAVFILAMAGLVYVKLTFKHLK